MNKPELYLKYVEVVLEDTAKLLTKYFPLIRRSTNAEKRALDIGCGPGNFTHNILLPFWEGDIDEIVGIDIAAQMIEHANGNYKNDRLTFKLINVAHNVPKEFMTNFDYVFSFWALHWIEDQRKLFSNILKMLKPSGDLLVIFPSKSHLYNIYQSVWKKARWARYITNFYVCLPPFQNSQNPAEDLSTILKEVGFETYSCQIEKMRIENMTAANLHGFLVSLIPVYDQIPKILQEEFISDHMKEVHTMDVPEAEGKYYMEFNLFVAHARKTSGIDEK